MAKDTEKAKAEAQEIKLDHFALQIGCAVIDSDFWTPAERRAPRDEETLRKLFKRAFDDITERIIKCSR